MQQVFPDQRDVSLENLAHQLLDEGSAHIAERPFIRAMMIASIDGAVRGSSGTSMDLTNAEDLAMLSMLRACSDAVLVGAATARTYPYRPPRPNPRWQDMRRDAGLTDTPRLVIVSRHGLPADNPCFSQPHNPPVFVVPQNCADLAELRTRAEVVLAGDTDVDVRTMVRALFDMGMRRIVCEGGPTLLSTMTRAGLIDELCLTTAPVWVGGAALRLSTGSEQVTPAAYSVSRVLLGADSYVFTQWRAQPHLQH